MKRIACRLGLPILMAVAEFLFFPSRAVAQGAGIDLARARQYFEEARVLCEKDGGTLWGVSLCGPVIFVDQSTRAVVANQADTESRLARSEDVFTGRFPEDQNIGNTAIRWAGVHWTMMLWPLPEDAVERARLMAHEMFHRV